jgi:tetratricopeptide (TPR) repeat protein
VLRLRRRRSSSPSDSGITALDQEIATYERALLDRPRGSAGRSPLLNNLAVRLRTRAGLTGDITDLRRALDLAREAAATADAAGPAGGIYLNTLGTCLTDRFAGEGSRADLDEAITAFRTAVENALDPSDQKAFTANLAGALADRYRHAGDAADLDRAVELVEHLRLAGIHDATERAGLAANYASLLQDRYAATGVIDDLDRAAEAAAAALTDAPPGTLTRMVLRTNLGGARQSLYERFQRRADLDAAIREFTAGLAESPPGAPGAARLHNNLGVAYVARARAGHDQRRRQDMDRSVAAHRQAVRSAGAVDRPLYANGLAAALADRYQESGKGRDLRAAVRIWRRAVAVTPAGAAPYARRIGNLARGAALTFERHGRRRDLARAGELYRRSCRAGLEIDPESTLSVGSDWGGWALRRGATGEAATAYDLAAQALDQLFKRQLMRSHKEAWLLAAPGVAAAGALAKAGARDLHGAVLALERGRALLLSEALQRDRADLGRLGTTTDADLARRFREAVARLDEIPQISGLPAGDGR